MYFDVSYFMFWMCLNDLFNYNDVNGWMCMYDLLICDDEKGWAISYKCFECKRKINYTMLNMYIKG